MKNLAAILSLAGLLLGGCSSSRQDYPPEDFSIQFYSSGGLSGMTEGFTLAGTGMATFWRGKSVPISSVTDSVKIGKELFDRIAVLVKAEELYSYQSRTAGELSTTVSLRSGSRTAVITWSGRNAPDDAPQALKDLVSSLNTITKPTH
jgi:hypothetical protein